MNPKIKKIINKKDGLAENDVKDLLKEYDIKTTNYKVIFDEKELDTLDLGFPLALKVCSSKILHKTEVNGVKLNISSKEELVKLVKDFKKRFPKENLLVEEMAKTGVEVIIGLIQDPTFSLSIMCGIGGIYTELYQDVSFRVIPIEKYDAIEMIDEIKGKKLLEGFRNIKADKQKVIDLLMKVSDMGLELIDYVDQMDLNPVFIYKDDYCVVDAKMVLKKNKE